MGILYMADELKNVGDPSRRARRIYTIKLIVIQLIAARALQVKLSQIGPVWLILENDHPQLLQHSSAIVE